MSEPTTATPTAEAPVAIADAEGKLSENWRESLPEELRGEASIQNHTSLTSVIQSLVSAEKMVGADKIVKPGKYATPDEQHQFFDQLGRPASPGEYELKPPEQMPEGVETSKETLEDFLAAAHAADLLPRQVQGIYDWYVKHMGEQIATAQSERDGARATATKELKKDWGMAYDGKLELAKTVIRTFADEAVVQALQEGVGNDPRLIRMFAKIGDAISEDTLKGMVPQGGMTPADAARRIAELQADPAYTDKYHPKHKVIVEEVTRLTEIQYPE